MEICGKGALIEGKLIRIARLDGEGYDFIEDPQSALREIKEARHRADVFTFIQKISDPDPKYSYRMEWYNLAALPVSTFDHWMTKQIDFKARNKARKAAKNGVVVKEVLFDDDFVKGIHGVYNESSVRQGKHFWHYGKDLETVRMMNGTFLDRSIFIGAYFEEELIGFVKMVTDQEGSQAGLMQIISMIRHRDKAPTNALVAQAVRSCADRGISFLWYANFTYGKKQIDGLAEFKRANGFTKTLVPRYFIPLTLKGRIALRLGLHHTASDWIPEPIAATYRKVRKIWYTKRLAGLESA
jgi:hypothetical protein